MIQPHPLGKLSRSQPVTAIIALALTLSGCGDRQPEGQTAAVVNGEPITETAVDMEIASSQNQLSRDRALQNLVERSLIIEEAKKQKLDQRPQYTLEVERLADMLLARQYAERLSQSSSSSLTTLDVNSFIDEHPEIGSNRRRITLKQVVFPEPTTPQLRADLEAAKSYTALIEALQAHRVKFEEGSTTVDSALASEPFLKAIASAEPGEPFLIISNGRALANAVDKEERIEMSHEQELALARARMQQSALTEKLQQLMTSWKKDANIEYSARYKPREKGQQRQSDPL
ncbi:hypothetical protein [Novosphingobium sp. M1R2S20]|uniref:EpsD family peptidyl-prolyl cis-trans isomerase n=1 Tax=Novosphingobium rhizovicinum TaxID=3228928 RepID=A0ABV3R8V6_9SPHN